jgi:hypothetical protein
MEVWATKEEVWVTKEEAKRISGLSDSTLERRVREGSLRREYQSRPGRKSEPIFARADLDKLIRPKSPIVIKTKPRSRRHLAIANGQNGTIPSDQPSIPPVPLHLKLYLPVPEAKAYSGRPKGFLEGKIAAGLLRVLKRGKRLISRAALQVL